MYLLIFKPTFDFVFSCIALMLFAPFFLILVIILFLSNQGNPFFFQKRLGKKGNIFTIIKLRTMNNKKDEKKKFTKKCSLKKSHIEAESKLISNTKH